MARWIGARHYCTLLDDAWHSSYAGDAAARRKYTHYTKKEDVMKVKTKIKAGPEWDVAG